LRIRSPTGEAGFSAGKPGGKRSQPSNAGIYGPLVVAALIADDKILIYAVD
jgi:hypothetical protein